MTVRPATAADAGAVAAIYSEGIAGRQATFETRPRTAEDVAPWFGRPEEPVLVIEVDGVVAGFGAVTRTSDRCAYRGVGEYGIYLAGWARGRGAGATLLEALARAAEAAGYWKLVGRMLTTNAASRALAHRCGFATVGVYRRHGRLEGEWRDVLAVERLLGEALD